MQAARLSKTHLQKIRTKNTVAKTIKGKPQKAVKTASRSVKGVKQSAQEDQDRTAFGKNSTAGGESGTENSAGHRKGG